MKKQHIIVAVVAVLAIVLGTVIAVNRNSNTKPVQSFTIGADFTLTGNTAFWSEQLRKGLDLAVLEANEAAAPGSPRVNVVYEDNQGNPGKAVSIWQKLDTIDGVSVVISCFTPLSKPLRENAATSKIPLLAAITAAQAFGSQNEWSFRDYMPQEQQCPALADYAYGELGLRSAACLVVNDDFGLDGDKAFTKAFEELGGKVIAHDTFEQSDTDMRSQVQKVINIKPDSIFIVGRNQSHALVIKQIRELGFTGRLLGGNGFDAKPTMMMVGDAGEGLVFTSAYFDLDSDEKGKAFSAKYAQRYNEPPEHVSVYGYTMGQYLSKTLLDTRGDRQAVRAALSKMEMPSIRGPLKMTPDRDVISALGIYIFESGSRKLLKKIEPEGTSDSSSAAANTKTAQ